jgi:hypothetical protein
VFDGEIDRTSPFFWPPFLGPFLASFFSESDH